MNILTLCRKTLFVLVAALVVSAPASGQVKGIAIAANADDGFFAAAGERPETALNAARSECRKAASGSCLRVRWCYPAGHSGAMSYLANREVTQVTYLCGAPSLDALTKMLAAQCAAMDAASECRLVASWDPDGQETERRTLLGKNTAD
ncbi:MAG: hypothetical protein AAGF49_16740 [Pseudomonadota bacterium]